VCGLVRPATRDDLCAVARDTLAHLDELHLFRVGERGCLARRARDDDAVGSSRDDVVDVLLYVAPVDFAV
jgi:hypothetical protein